MTPDAGLMVFFLMVGSLLLILDLFWVFILAGVGDEWGLRELGCIFPLLDVLQFLYLTSAFENGQHIWKFFLSRENTNGNS